MGLRTDIRTILIVGEPRGSSRAIGIRMIVIGDWNWHLTTLSFVTPGINVINRGIALTWRSPEVEWGRLLASNAYISCLSCATKITTIRVL